MKTSIDELSEFIKYQKTDEFLKKIESQKNNLQELNQSGYTLLHVAAKIENSKSIINKLVELGLDVDIKDPNGDTPLMISANYNCPKNLKTLLELKANHSIYNNSLNSALHFSCSGNYFESTKILIENKADVNADNGNKKTPFINAVYAQADIELIEYLLKNNADINYGNGNGTPLMYAIAYKNLTLVKYLLSRGAKIKGFKNKSGEDTLTYAKRVGNIEIINYLENQIEE
jgi:ankyrin repeat protein